MYIRTSLLGLFLLISTLSVPALAKDECQIAEKSIKEASLIRGLKMKKEVPCLINNKEQVKEYLLNTIDTKIPPERLKFEEIIYQALGFISEEYDYKNGIIDLYVSQIGGYYDPENDHYVMAGWLPSFMQAPVAVHELTHALQDQHYKLDTFMDLKKLSTDEMVARSALVEGDATAVMMDYARKMIGQPPLAKAESVKGIMIQNMVGAAVVAAGQNVPQSLIAMMIFPYTSGLNIAHHALRKGGYKEIDKLYPSPPKTTEEILHPEKYWSKDRDSEHRELSPKDVAQPWIETGESIQYSDTFGEFSLSALLHMYGLNGARAAKAAEGWGGDKVVVLDNSTTKEQKVIWKLLWDHEDDQKEFLEIFREGFEYTYPSLPWSLGRWIPLSKKRDIQIQSENRESTIIVKIRS